MPEYSEQTKARIRTLMDEGARRAAAACVTCGCDPAEHFEPDWYDPRTQAADEDSHLNHCGNCAGCFSPEYEEANGG